LTANKEERFASSALPLASNVNAEAAAVSEDLLVFFDFLETFEDL
jgi:hypothetical protein